MTRTTGGAVLSVADRSIRTVLTPPVRRTGADACPGALRLHAAADGPLARVRLPGGRLTGEQLGAVRDVAVTWGDAHVELTSRGNLQLRGLTGAPPGELAAALWAAGLLPSQTHELVRNIVAAPVPDGWDVDSLDRGLLADPRLAELSGRFLFSLGLATGDVAAVRLAGSPAILLAGLDAGLRGDVVATMLAAAHAFLDERAAQGSSAWRLRELADGPARVAARLGAPQQPVAVTPPPAEEPIGAVRQPDGRVAAAALVPLGRLDSAQLGVLVNAERLVVTPWRGVLIPDLSSAGGWLAAMRGAGLEVAPDSRWSGVTACAGRPGCAKALADVRRDAHRTARFGDGLPVHWIGCARGCGSPSGAHVRVEATGSGYAVTAPGFAAEAVDPGALVAAARRSS